jgi:ParB family chromosome partitioning protein
MQSGQEVVSLHLDDIIPNRFQPREVFDERALKELAASIKEHGVIQPIIVRQVNNKYEIIAGERRYKASALAGMTKIPAIINNLDDKEAAKVALLENLQRRNLNPIEEARTYQKILELDEMTQDSLAKTMGKSQSAVSNKLRLLALTDEVQTALLKEEISERHARTLLNAKNPEEQKMLLKRVIDEKMSVRKLEEEISKLAENTINNKMPIPSNINQDSIGGENMNLMETTSFDKESIPGGIPDNFSGIGGAIPDNFRISSENNSENTVEKENSKILPTLPSDIINYGEVDDDDIDENNQHYDTSVFNNTNVAASSKPNVSQIKTDTMDINKLMGFDKKVEQRDHEDQNNTSESTIRENKISMQNQNQKISNDLDSLLNIKPKSKDFNPTIDMVNSNTSKEELNKKDYFQTNDLKDIDLPNISSTTDAFIKNYNEPMQVEDDNYNNINMNQNLSFFQSKQKKKPQKEENNKSLGMALIEETYKIPPKEQAKEYNIHQMVQQIRNTIQMLEKSGAKIDTDEIDFENQYQIVIRIDKNN